VNKNITGAVVREKPGTEPGVHKLLPNYQTGFGCKFWPMNGWYAIGFFRVEFLNASKHNPLKRDKQSFAMLILSSSQL